MLRMLLDDAEGGSYEDLVRQDQESAKRMAREMAKESGKQSRALFDLDYASTHPETRPQSEVGDEARGPAMNEVLDEDINALATTGEISAEQAARMKQTAQDLAVYMVDDPDAEDEAWQARAEGYTDAQLAMMVILACLEDYSTLGRIRLIKTVVKRPVQPTALPQKKQRRLIAEVDPAEAADAEQALVVKTRERKARAGADEVCDNQVLRPSTSPWLCVQRQEAFLRRVIHCAVRVTTRKLEAEFKAWFIEQDILRAKLIQEATDGKLGSGGGSPIGLTPTGGYCTVVDDLDQIEFLTIKPFEERNEHHVPAKKIPDTGTLGIIRLINKLDKGVEDQRKAVEAKLRAKQWRLEALLRDEQARRSAQGEERHRKMDIERRFMVERLRELYAISHKKLGYSLFFRAACTGDAAVFRTHRRAHQGLKAVLDSRDFHKRTPLHFAAYFNQLEVVQYLTNEIRFHGRDRTDSGYTTLHYAVLGGSLRAVEIIVKVSIQRGMLTRELYALNDEGVRARQLAHKAGYLNIEQYLKNIEERYPVRSMGRQATTAAERATRDIVGQETMRITLEAEATAEMQRKQQQLVDTQIQEKERVEAMRKAEALKALQHCKAEDERKRKEALVEAQRRAIEASRQARYSRRVRIAEDSQHQEMLKMAEEDLDYWDKIVETEMEIYTADDATLLQKAGLSTAAPSTAASELPHLGLFLTDQQRVDHPDVNTLSYGCVLVLHCVPPAADTDIAPGDIITSINGQAIHSTRDVHIIMKKLHKNSLSDSVVRIMLNGDKFAAVTPVQLDEDEAARFDASRYRGTNRVATTIPFARTNYRYPTGTSRREEPYTCRFGAPGGREHQFVHELPAGVLREADGMHDQTFAPTGKAAKAGGGHAVTRAAGWGVGHATVKVTLSEVRGARGIGAKWVALAGVKFFGPGGREVPVVTYQNPTMAALFASGLSYRAQIPCAVIATFARSTIITGYAVCTSAMDSDMDPTYGILSVRAMDTTATRGDEWEAVHVWPLKLPAARGVFGPTVPVYRHSPPESFFKKYAVTLNTMLDADVKTTAGDGGLTGVCDATTPKTVQTSIASPTKLRGGKDHFSMAAVPPPSEPRRGNKTRWMNYVRQNTPQGRSASPSQIHGSPFAPTPPRGGRGTPQTARAPRADGSEWFSPTRDGDDGITDSDAAHSDAADPEGTPVTPAKQQAWDAVFDATPTPPQQAKAAVFKRRGTPPAKRVVTTPPLSPRSHPLRKKGAGTPGKADPDVSLASTAAATTTPEPKKRLRYI